MRIKIKIKPGRDVGDTAAVRDAFGAIPLQVDANSAYTLADAATLAELDRFDLLLIEQPLQEDDLVDHATLARSLRTPVCLDESIVSDKAAADALALGSASVINIKAGRVGGYLEAVRIHDLCREAGVPVWCGGMLETGIGRAANAALAALPGFTLPGDVSASSRFYARDIVTEPAVLEDGHVRVPTGHGLGVEIDPVALEDFTVVRETLTVAGTVMRLPRWTQLLGNDECMPRSAVAAGRGDLRSWIRRCPAPAVRAAAMTSWARPRRLRGRAERPGAGPHAACRRDRRARAAARRCRAARRRRCAWRTGPTRRSRWGRCGSTTRGSTAPRPG